MREEKKTAMSELVPPRISRGRAAVTVVAALTLTGALIGALWAWLAPPVHGVVRDEREGASLPVEIVVEQIIGGHP